MRLAVMRDINGSDSIDTDEFEDEELSALAELIHNRFDDASSARNDIFYAGKSINEWLTEAHERYMANKCNDDFTLIRIKVDVIHAKVKDMSVGSIDAPFVIKPTPIPELSREQTESIEIDLQSQLAEKLLAENIIEVDSATGAVTPRFSAVMEGHKLLPTVADWLKEQAKAQKKSQQYEAGLIASVACENATRVMLDQMLEGSWKKANLDADFDDFLYGTSCLREEVKSVKVLGWNGNKLQEQTDEQMTWRHVPVHNCYPSPDSEHAQKGTYFIERAEMTKQEVYACKELDWFDDERIDEAIEKCKESIEWLGDNPETSEGWGDDQAVSVLIHEGSVSGDTLNEYFEYDDDDEQAYDNNKFYDIEAYVLADTVISCRLLNHPYGTRSYYSCNYKTAGKSFWGIGVAMLLAVREDKLNQYEQDLAENLDKTIAPPIFYNIDMFESPNHVEKGLQGRGKIIPYNVDRSLTAGVPNKPYDQVRFDSKTGELTSLFSRAYRLADDESGIPSLLSGNSEMNGGEATFRGMKLLVASASTIIKSYFHNKDETRIVPAMRNLWYWNMLNNDDESIKADSKVVTRGTAGLMAQEIANAERLEAMPVIASLLQASSLDEVQKANIADYLLRETMVTGGMPANQLMDNPEASAELEQSVKDAQPVPVQTQQQALPATAPVASVPPANPSLKPATPLPTIGADNYTGGL